MRGGRIVTGSTYEAFGGDIGRGETTRDLIVVDNHPRGAILQTVQLFCAHAPTLDGIRSGSNAWQHPSQSDLHR